MNPAPAIAGALVATLAAIWSAGPGRSLSTAAADLGALLSGSITLSAAQRNMAAIISAEFGSAGFGWLANAAIANAYAESRLDPLAAGDGGLAIGLFQLHARGAGAGMTVADREDPVTNTRRILDEVRGPNGLPVRSARGMATHAELASLFAQHVERCWACGYGGGSAELAVRAGLVTKLFGSQVAGSIP